MDVRGQLGEWIFFFHHVVPMDCTQTVRLSHKCLHPLSLLPAPVFPFLLERFCHPFFKTRVTGNRLFISLLPGMSSLLFLSSGCMTLGDRFFFSALEKCCPFLLRFVMRESLSPCLLPPPEISYCSSLPPRLPPSFVSRDWVAMSLCVVLSTTHLGLTHCLESE